MDTVTAVSVPFRVKIKHICQGARVKFFHGGRILIFFMEYVKYYYYYYYMLCSQIEVPEHSNCRLVPY